MDLHISNILLLGAGKMGGALLAACERACKGTEQNITVVEADALRVAELKRYSKANIEKSFDAVSRAPDVIIIAVKPQNIEVLMPQLAERYGSKPLYLSIVAGKTVEYFKAHVGNAAVVRAMTNTPAFYQKGMNVLFANSKVSKAQKDQVQSLFDKMGATEWLDDESLMDAVTAISGSGPAYVLLFMEALIEAGKAQGLPEEFCKRLVIETVSGSVELVRHSPESIMQLRKNVTSPGGTTEAALQKFTENSDFETLIKWAVAAAVKRAKELA